MNTKPEAEVTARLNDYGYCPVEPFEGKFSIICPACNAKHEVAIKVFEKLQDAAYTTAPRPHREAEFPPISYSGQRLRGLPSTGVKVLLWAIVVILGLYIGGVQAGLVAAVLIFPVLGPLAQWLFGKSVPIWLLSCSQCRARIPVATDGKVILVAGEAVATEVGTEAVAIAGEPARGMPQQTVVPTVEPPTPEPPQLTGAGKLARIGPPEEKPARGMSQQTVASTTGPPPEDAQLTGAGKLARIRPLEGKPAQGVPQQTVASTTGPPTSERPEELEKSSSQKCRTVYAFVQRALAGQPASLQIRITQLEELHDALMRQFIGQGKPIPEVGRLLDASLYGECPACSVRIPGETLTAAAMFQSSPVGGKMIFVGGPGPHSRLTAGQCPNCDSHELVIYWQP
jgi:hypothetical protein